MADPSLTSFGSEPERVPGWGHPLPLTGIVLVVTAMVGLFMLVRPPTVEEVERDIWTDWARLATDSQGRTLVDQVLDGQNAAGQRLLETLGTLIRNNGERFVVRTEVRDLRIVDREGKVFAAWNSPDAELGPGGWRTLRLDLTDPAEGKVGVLEVTYRFYRGGLDHLPNIRRLGAWYTAALWLVVVLAAVGLLAIRANALRIRERAGRLRSQQITLDLAHQMCHELRNGLWAFSLEGQNLRHLVDQVDEFTAGLPEVLEQSADRCGLDPETWRRFERALYRQLARRHLDPQTDLRSSGALAQDALTQIEAFSNYLHLTVEELDRKLLGTDGQWQEERFRLEEAWNQSSTLLSLRFKSAGVTYQTQWETTEDWVRGDRRALVHVFVNLSKNAIEALRDAPPPRELTITVRRVGEQIECSLSNNGPAIPEANLPRLFEPGFSTKSGTGRGTGLAVVRDSLRRMGATISVESGYGKPTRFLLRFPIALPAE